MPLGTDDIDAILDARFGNTSARPSAPVASTSGNSRAFAEEEPTPSPSPSPSASPDVDTDILASVQQIAQDSQGTRIATTGAFEVLCLLLAVVIGGVLFSALRRRN